MLTKDGKSLLICASDDDTVQILDLASNKIVGTLPSGPDPELLNIHPSGSPVYVANEDDSLATAIDLNGRKVVAEVPVGVEPEGVGVSPDGKTLIVTSETSNMPPESSDGFLFSVPGKSTISSTSATFSAISDSRMAWRRLMI